MRQEIQEVTVTIKRHEALEIINALKPTVDKTLLGDKENVEAGIELAKLLQNSFISRKKDIHF